MRNYFKEERGFMTMVGLLLAIVIICVLAYKAYDIYLNKPVGDEQTRKSLAQDGINISSQQGAFFSTKDKVKDINQMIEQREGKMLNEVLP